MSLRLPFVKGKYEQYWGNTVRLIETSTTSDNRTINYNYMSLTDLIVLEIVAINGERYKVKFPNMATAIWMNFFFLQQYLTNSKYKIIRNLAAG